MRAAVIAAIAALAVSPAHAHSWYTGLQNAGGQLCCNDRDCHQLSDTDVTEVAGGYRIESLKATVPYGALQPSPDGKWHACFWGGEVKCFFGPLPSY